METKVEIEDEHENCQDNSNVIKTPQKKKKKIRVTMEEMEARRRKANLHVTEVSEEDQNAIEIFKTI